MRSPIKPNEYQKKLTEEACLLRGRIISGYSMVEYVLAGISVQMHLKFPYRIAARIKAAKKIVEQAGYEAYRNDFHRVCDALLRFDDLRNFMAHGILFRAMVKESIVSGLVCPLRSGPP
jgi:hypothetical protein